jgi:hypothetical protein
MDKKLLQLQPPHTIELQPNRRERTDTLTSKPRKQSICRIREDQMEVHHLKVETDFKAHQELISVLQLRPLQSPLRQELV